MTLEEKVFVVICIPFLLLLLGLEIVIKNILKLRNSYKRSELKRMVFEYMNSLRHKNKRWKFYDIEVMDNIMKPSYFNKLKVQVELNELIKEGKVVVFNSGCSIFYMLKEDAEIAIKYRNKTLESPCQQKTDIFYLEPDTPLYEDIVEIKKCNEEGKIELYSHTEVWGE